MAKKPEPPKAVTWDVYRAAHKPKIVGSVDADEAVILARQAEHDATIAALAEARARAAESHAGEVRERQSEIARLDELSPGRSFPCGRLVANRLELTERNRFIDDRAEKPVAPGVARPGRSET